MNTAVNPSRESSFDIEHSSWYPRFKYEDAAEESYEAGSTLVRERAKLSLKGS
jgi:hypothetical protein